MKNGNCVRCHKRQPAESLQHCEYCLAEVVEGRARRALASSGALKLHQNGAIQQQRFVIACNDRNSIGCVAARDIFGRIVGKDAELRLASPAAARRVRGAILINPFCADDFAAAFIEAIASGAKRKVPNAGIAVFECVTEKELLAYASMKNLKYAAVDSGDKGWIKHAIQGFRDGHPGMIEGLAQSARKLRELK